MQTQTFYEEWKDVVERTARFVSRDFPDVETEDLTQDLFTFVLARGWTSSSDDSVRAVIRWFARAKAMEYRKQQLQTSVQYSYRTTEIRSILEKVFDHDNWPRRAVPTYRSDEGNDVPQWGLMTDESMEREGFGSQEGNFNRLPRVHDNDIQLVGGVSRPVLDFDDRLAAFADVKQAWQRMPLEYKKTIFKRYALGWEPESEAEKKRVWRAVERLTDILNFFRGPR
jgi:hypothetical protein